VAEVREKMAWSLQEYRDIISKYKPIICDYPDTAGRDSFCIIRHDVEFSVSRAFDLMKIDSECGIRASFFFQVMNGAYNPLSVANRALIRQIAEAGHHVGLHLYVSHIEPGDVATLRRELAFQRDILAAILGRAVDRFSYHRPPRWVLALEEPVLDDIINAYAPEYFELTDGAPPAEILYMADSQHNWKYGHPLDDSKYRKFQILLHADEWTGDGAEARDNFHELIERNRAEFVEIIRSECNHYDRIMAN